MKRFTQGRSIPRQRTRCIKREGAGHRNSMRLNRLVFGRDRAGVQLEVHARTNDVIPKY